ncbi:class I SAM-dependent methyltransferase [Roseovarius sp. A46]|nr:class I SAM-dependent methyltransferase [Roseovarius sp. A46]
MSILKRLEKYISAFFKLGRIERIAKEGNRAAQENAHRLEEARRSLDAFQTTFRREMDAMHGDLRKKMEETAREQQASFEAYLADKSVRDRELSHRLAKILTDQSRPRTPRPSQDPAKASEKQSERLDAFLDTFYNCLENRFRGNHAVIANRLRVYQADVEAAVERTEGKPALDLACGRGEWLSLMRDFGIEATGVDINAVQIASAQANNLKALHKDAFEALAEAEDNSLSVISAHHFIEHISFRDLAWVTLEAQRILAPGGVLLFETPNPENIIVGATNFYIDPTHKHPLPWQLLEVLFDTAGFQNIETRRLHPGDNFEAMRSEPNVHAEIAHLLFGPQDLAILGTKPQATE